MTDALEIVSLFYSSLAQGDVVAALGLLSPDVEWIPAERSPYNKGVLVGSDAIIANVFEPITNDFDNFAATPFDFVSEGNRVASFGAYSGVSRKTGANLNAPFMHLWTAAGGHLQRFVQYTDPAAWNQALGNI